MNESYGRSFKIRNEFTFYDQYNIERVIEVKHVRDSITNVFFESDLHHKILVFAC